MEANEAAKILGAKGGQAKSEKKRLAVAENLKKARAARSDKAIEKIVAKHNEKRYWLLKIKSQQRKKMEIFDQKEKELIERLDQSLVKKLEKIKEKRQGGGGSNNSVSQSDAGLQTSPLTSASGLTD